MTSEINLNSTDFLMLENQIRITANSSFNAQEAYENTFEDVLLEQSTKVLQEEKENNFIKEINFSNLGMPAGFVLDTSLLDAGV